MISGTRRNTLLSLQLLVGVALCIEISTPDIHAQESAGASSSLKNYIERRIKKITANDCKIYGGEYSRSNSISADDIVDCLLPPIIRRGRNQPELNTRIVGSVYDYLFEVGTEKPDCGLYSYVLIPVNNPRAERLLDVVIATMSYVERSGLACKNVNVLYLPTSVTSRNSLVSLARNNEPIKATVFAHEFYNYPYARQLLGELCLEPPDTLREICATDLSRGPYLLTYNIPVSAASPISPPFLLVDLSNVHELAFAEFVAAYKEQVKRSNFSDRERIDTLRLGLLSIVLTAADWVTPIRGAIADTLHLTLSSEQD